MGEWSCCEPEQRGRAQKADAEGAVLEHAGSDQASLGEARHHERIGPGRAPRDDAGDGALGSRPLPEQPGGEGRPDLGDGGEGQQADLRQLHIAGGAVIEICEQDDGEDRDPPDHQQQAHHVLARLALGLGGAAAQQQRHDGSLDTMIAMATHSTMTMAVAAERPPTKASKARLSKPAASGTAST